ncbi:MAG: T9SS type A sorting domain-containing protein [Ignavibacteria bacterium]|nr:T9SS type A sorting domain-containing protein [Ignavibacteria bacterium]
MLTSSRIVPRIHLHIIVFTLVMVSALSAQSVTYYVDAVSGVDANNGTSTASAWQSLTKVNGRTFQPGDSILFKSGSVWTGQLIPKGSGVEGKPIVVGMYGGIVKPRIDGKGVIGQGTVYLFNAEYWEITSLEITNDAVTAGDRRGVLVAAADFGLVHHIYLKNLDIHNVRGIVGNEDPEKRTAGIGIETTRDASVPTRYDDVLIENCTISYIENTGLYTDFTLKRGDYPYTPAWLGRRFTNVRIRNNVIHHISKNAMILRLLDGGLVEHNVCYETATATTGNTMFTRSCNGTVFQYNEGYNNRSTGADGSMYDADLQSPNCIFQYSYSHDNAHGLFWTCTEQADSGVICRYNISQNDKGIIFCINYPNTSVYCYNNTVYIGPGLSPKIISERNVFQGTRKYYFLNNIIYNRSTTASYDSETPGYTRVIDNNFFYGFRPSKEPDDAHKLISDPMLVNPGSAGTGIGTIDGYKLQAGSPAINSGLALKNHATKDFWGNPVPNPGGTVDRGAFEYQQTTGVNDDGTGPPRQHDLAQNYPNPFNPATNIFFELATPQHISLAIYNLSGRNVRTIKKGLEWSGSHVARWDGTDDVGHQVSSGAYFARLTSEAGSSTVRMILIR